ncbi:MAG: Nif3-like dinuclear metal center hexameric protein [Oscillospiraceae bacterium]|nr:Nif3-like dinuclear metal center hexameric protein [Oscillospiraceae bacterium]
MKFKDLINYLDEQFPRSLSISGDKDGVEVCVDYDLEIRRILAVVDITFEVINYAITNGYNCILSHHPMIYEPLKKLDLSSTAIKKAVMLASHNICAASYHTRLDSVNGGVNDSLLNAFNISNKSDNIEKTEFLYALQDENIPIGRFVTLDKEINLSDFISDLRKSLRKFYKINFSCDFEFGISCISRSGKVKKIGVVSGGGMDFAEAAAKMGADTFLTGEGKYHGILDAYESFDMNIITAGHFETEAVVLPFMKEKILDKFPEAKIDCFIGEI